MKLTEDEKFDILNLKREAYSNGLRYPEYVHAGLRIGLLSQLLELEALGVELQPNGGLGGDVYDISYHTQAQIGKHQLIFAVWGSIDDDEVVTMKAHLVNAPLEDIRKAYWRDIDYLTPIVEQTYTYDGLHRSWLAYATEMPSKDEIIKLAQEVKENINDY